MATKKKTSDQALRQVLEVQPRKGDLRKAEIIKQVVECIGDIGIEETSFESVGKRLKIRRSHVAYYFKDRQDMLMLAVRYIYSVWQQYTVFKIDAISNQADLPLVQAHALIDLAKEYPSHVKVQMWLYYACVHNTELREFLVNAREMGRERMAAILEKQGHKDRESNIRVAMFAQAFVMGTIFEVFSTYGSQYKSRLEILREPLVDQIRHLISEQA